MQTITKAIIGTIFFMCITDITAQSIYNDLLTDFKNPPQTSKPRTWMHAMSGNMTAEGLTKDLKACADVGIGGVILFNICQGIPNGPVVFNSPQHRQLLAHAAEESKNLGLNFGIHICDGWSATGGPWINEANSMKKVVIRDTIVTIVDQNKIFLPPAVEGFHQDIATIAFPIQPTLIPKSQMTISASSSNLSGNFDNKIQKDFTDKPILISNKSGDELPYILLDAKSPSHLVHIEIGSTSRTAQATLLASNEGIAYDTIRLLEKYRTGKSSWVFVGNSKLQKYTHYKILFDQAVSITNLNIDNTERLPEYIAKSGMARIENYQLQKIDIDSIAALNAEQYHHLNLVKNTDEIDVSKLEAKSWHIMRIGYTTTGATNHPASWEGRGLEADKWSRSAFKIHWDAYVQKVIDQVNQSTSSGLKTLEIDSYEMGGQTWTEGLDSLFMERYNYNLIPYLPALLGFIVDSPLRTELFLEDFRNIGQHLMHQNYYKYFQELCHREGIQGYIEPYGFGTFNDLDAGKYADIPMGEFWMNRPLNRVQSAIHSAHIYNKSVISAESFTAGPEVNWQGYPEMAKLSGDKAWVEGINEFMFHRFAHQANTHVSPGMTMNRWGFHFDRTQTWWYQSGKSWFEYIARGSHLLRQGKPIIDLAIFIGDQGPSESLLRDQIPIDLPPHITYDCINGDVLVNNLQSNVNELYIEDGIKYKALLLHNTHSMSIATLKKLVQLAKGGAKIYGPLPQRPIGLSGLKQIDTFEVYVKELQQYVKPQSNWSLIGEEITYTDDVVSADSSPFAYNHRKTGDVDIYFIVNTDTTAHNFTFLFNIANKVPELWDPSTGEIEKLVSFQDEGMNTSVPIRLHAGESTFVIFHEESKHTLPKSYLTTSDTTYTLNQYDEIQSEYPLHNLGRTNLKKGWDIDFKIADTTLTIKDTTLFDWTHHQDDRIKYYSGTAKYWNDIEVHPDQLLPGLRHHLQLSDINAGVLVRINGRNVKTLWTKPYQVDITEFLKHGLNNIELRVTNLWTNRLIGDEKLIPNDTTYRLGPHRCTDALMPDWYTSNQPMPPGPRTTFTTANFYTSDDRILPSGILGQVSITYSQQSQSSYHWSNDTLLIVPPKGRLAISSDGNLHDTDDWGATAMALTMLSQSNLGHKIVHYDYSNHIGESRPAWNSKMDTVIDLCKANLSLPNCTFYNDQDNPDEAVQHFKVEAEKCSADNPLTLICAGPMEMSYRMLSQVPKEKLSYITCVSHHWWNEKHNHGECRHTWADMKRDFPEVSFINIRDQNRSNSQYDFATDNHYWQWLKEDPQWQWLYDIDDTYQVDMYEIWNPDTGHHFDVSDAGITLWWLTGGHNQGKQDGGWREAKAIIEGRFKFNYK